jgi:methylmalonyl-CoA mutase cobalamin-binding subunit
MPNAVRRQIDAQRHHFRRRHFLHPVQSLRLLLGSGQVIIILTALFLCRLVGLAHRSVGENLSFLFADQITGLRAAQILFELLELLLIGDFETLTRFDAQADALLKPILAQGNATSAGKAVIGTVNGDLHDIGKNLVGISLEGAGFEVIDLGADVPVEAFVTAIREHKPAVVGLSALLTTTMPGMRDVIEAIRSAGLRQGVKIMIGGAPITQKFATEIGADFYGPDSTSAKDYARTVL